MGILAITKLIAIAKIEGLFCPQIKSFSNEELATFGCRYRAHYPIW